LTTNQNDFLDFIKSFFVPNLAGTALFCDRTVHRRAVLVSEGVQTGAPGAPSGVPIGAFWCKNVTLSCTFDIVNAT